MAASKQRTRSKKKGSKSNQSSSGAGYQPRNLRQRSPIVYWVAVFAVLMMLLSSFGSVALFLLY